MNRRAFLERISAAALVSRAASGQVLDLEETSISGRREVSAHDATEWYLARIRQLDPRLRAVIEINPDALAIATALDQGPRRGPLHGAAVLIKDNIDTGDRMKTTAGSLALLDAPQPRDAELAVRLRAAGAVILGKTNLSEWADFRSPHSLSGWSGRGGQTRNPYALDRTPCGSSSGSAAAVAANLCAAAVGTETDGSIVLPAAMNGIVGLKPTVGLISTRGVVPIAHSQDTPGPLARTVRDAAVLLGALAEGPHAAQDYTRFLDPGGLAGARLGVARKFFGVSAEGDRLVEEALAEMRRHGALIVDPADLPSFGRYTEWEDIVVQHEFKANVNEYLRARGCGLTLEKLIEFNERRRDDEMPYFEQEIFLAAQKRGPLTDASYRLALETLRKLARDDGIDAVVAKHKLDAIVAPTAGPAWLIDTVNGDYDTGGCSTPAAAAGYPHITVPAGFVHGLPVGVSFFGPAWSEPVLLKLAYAFEQITRVRRKPALPPTLGS
jgi:amidase